MRPDHFVDQVARHIDRDDDLLHLAPDERVPALPVHPGVVHEDLAGAVEGCEVMDLEEVLGNLPRQLLGLVCFLSSREGLFARRLLYLFCARDLAL